MSLRNIYKERERKKTESFRIRSVMFTVMQRNTETVHLLYHDAVNAHVSVSSGEVEQVDPAQSETQHHTAQVVFVPPQVQSRRQQEQSALHQTLPTEEKHLRACTAF